MANDGGSSAEKGVFPGVAKTTEADQATWLNLAKERRGNLPRVALEQAAGKPPAQGTGAVTSEQVSPGQVVATAESDLASTQNWGVHPKKRASTSTTKMKGSTG